MEHGDELRREQKADAAERHHDGNEAETNLEKKLNMMTSCAGSRKQGRLSYTMTAARPFAWNMGA